MDELQKKIQLIIGGDAKKAEDVLKEVNKSIANTGKQAAKHGRDVGDKFGHAMERAQDRWLKVAQDGFRRYFGSIGGYIADALEQYEKFDKAVNASNRVKQIRGTLSGAPSVRSQVAAQTTSGAVTNALKSAERQEANSTFGFGEQVAANSLGAGGAAFAGGVAHSSWLQRTKNLANERKSANQMALAFGHTPPNPGRLQTYAEAALAGLSKVGRIPLSAIGFGAGAIGAGLLGGIGLNALAARGEGDRQSKEKELAGYKQLIAEINKAKTPADRTKAILKELGENGVAQFDKIKEAVQKADEELQKSPNYFRTFQFASKMAFTSIADYAKTAASAIIMPFGIAFQWLVTKATGITPKFVKDFAEGIAMTDRLTKKLEERKIEALKKREAEEKAYEEDLLDTVDAQDAYTQAVKDSKYEFSVLDDKVAILQKRQKEYSEALMFAGDQTRIQNKLLKEQVELENDVKRLKKEQAQVAIEKGDKQRLSLSELATMKASNAAQLKNIKKAQEIQSLEEKARNSVAGGDFINATKNFGKAQALRRQLGVAGILQSGEFTPPDPQKFSNNKSVSFAEMISKNPDLYLDYARLSQLQEALKAHGIYKVNPEKPFDFVDQENKRRDNLKAAIEVQQAKIKEKLENRANKDPLMRLAEVFSQSGNRLPIVPVMGP